VVPDPAPIRPRSGPVPARFRSRSGPGADLGGPAAAVPQQCWVTQTPPDNPCACSERGLRSFFRDAGLRCTRQRELVYSALAATRAHPTADELHGAVRAEDPGISLATVYNTLEAFTAAGLCRRLPSANGAGPCRYDADTSPHAHVALADGRVVDVPESLGDALLQNVPPELLARVEAELGVRISDVSVTLHAAEG